MTPTETRAASSLAAVFSVRLLGLFMIYPVFATYAHQLQGATAYTIGLALGIYGLTQGLLQIPFGLASDKIGRKRMIVLGLLVFAAGSAIAAMSHTIMGMVIGRAIQGAGAVGSVILALVADLTAEENRTKAMATVGITIGFSFMVAVVAGPIAASLVGVSGIFWLMVALGLAGIAITLFVVPHPPRATHHRDAQVTGSMFGRILRDGELLRLDFGIFALHAMLTSSFLVMPQLLNASLGITAQQQWMVYLPVFAVAVVVMVPAIIIAEKHRKMKAVVVSAIVAMAATQVLLVFASNNTFALLAGVTVFFTGFNIMEASLPSLVTKTAPAEAKGTASGIYSSSQFIGIFVGGVFGGWAHKTWGDPGVFMLSSAIALAWVVIAATMREPRYLTTRLLRVDGNADAGSLAQSLKQLPGVAEALVVAEEGLAYLKVDSRDFDADAAQAVAGVA